MTAAVAYRSQTAPARKRSAAPKRQQPPDLRVLDQATIRRRARRRNAVLTLFMVLLSGLFLVAFVHARLVESQQDLDLMRTRIAELGAEKAQIERAVDEASSPSIIVERANELGMVRAENPVFLTAVDTTPPATGLVADTSPMLIAAEEPGTLRSRTPDGEMAVGTAQTRSLDNAAGGTEAALGGAEDG